ncbi:probable serine/threonine-protein kinase DDB_G0280717 [Dermacentor andersoni]|uniref:probable serine/threonine-protein kinase DDB_G0280717 n=1 Tax=Dermacentor andersoni TaxID=34620 RepID=UPI0024167461|nr:microtubule-associated serine/threonine-protein kinase 2-like [Dermacentor andersoni]
MAGLHNLTYKKAQHIAKELGDSIRKLVVIVGELATSLEKVSDVPPTDWMGIGDTIVAKTEKVNLAEIAPFWTYIPKMKDFLSIKLLGAGGFGAVYKAAYKPTNLVCTIKLVACDRFQRHKQACIDKVVASIIRCPFLVKYYACYCTRDAYVTVMEYICGADLMRVVDKAVYLPTEECRIVMAQLILALEHMHLRGLLHRDIKVSNMLIIPGGRVKVIDFDTNKVCIGHFSKRVCRGYFSKTAFEFHDGESAGTVPYMAPEILKRRPYGRACDWWSAGATMYKMMTGRVPFRGETKEELMDKIINQPLRWPKVEEHPHSATPEAKDMVFKMLKKNPVERLGSTTYAEIKEHPFFAGFNWKRLCSAKDICNIPAIGDCMTRKKGDGKPERLTTTTILAIIYVVKQQAAAGIQLCGAAYAYPPIPFSMSVPQDSRAFCEEANQTNKHRSEAAALHAFGFPDSGIRRFCVRDAGPGTICSMVYSVEGTSPEEYHSDRR